MIKYITAKSKGALYALCLTLLLAAALVAGCSSEPKITEEEVRARVQEEIALLKPLYDISVDKIDVSIKDRGYTLNGVTMKSDILPQLVMRIDKVLVSGADMNTFIGKPEGLSKYDKIAYSNMRFFYEGMEVGSIGDYSCDGTELNEKDLIQALRDLKAAGQTTPEQVIKKMMPLFSTFKCAKAYGNGIKFNFMIVNASIDSFELNDLSMSKYGPGHASNYQVYVMGSKVFSMEKMSFAGAEFPAFFTEMMRDPAILDGTKEPAFVKELQADPMKAMSPFTIRNVVMDKISVDPMLQIPVSADKWTMDFGIVDSRLDFKTDISNLLLTKQFMAALPDLQEIAAAVKQDLNLSGGMNFAMATKDDPILLEGGASVSDAGLGGGSVSISLDMPRSVYVQGYGFDDSELQRIRSFEFSVENNGLLEFLMALYASMNSYEYESYEDVYEEVLETLYALEEEGENAFEKEAAAAMIQLVEKGGKLTMSLKPDQPIKVSDLENHSDADLQKLGFTVLYTPPAQ
ncbi:hypothetical protein LJC36_02910 [Desulfovibrio sp. OttesenSCG-928-C14]|nr:hypothetical protein [Desulfovibrio sp. OttesenSCG-928-C14]